MSWEGFIPGQPAAKTHCDQGGKSALLGPNPQIITYFIGAPVLLSPPLEHFTHGGGPSALSETVYQMHWLWYLLGCASQGQLLPVFCLRPPVMSYKVICRCLLLVLCLAVLRRGQLVNQSWLPFLLDLGPLNERYCSH